MVRYFLFFWWACSLAFANADVETTSLNSSTPEQMAGIYGDELIAGIVSPLSGQLITSKIDLIARGAQDVQLHRVYVPLIIEPEPEHPAPVSSKGLSNKERKVKDRIAKLEYCDQKSNYWFALQANVFGNQTGWRVFPHHRMIVWHHEHSSERTVIFVEANGAIFSFKVSKQGSSLLTETYGMNNVSGDVPSGSYDPRNIRMVRQKTQIIVSCPDGTTRVYMPHPPYSSRFDSTFRVDYVLHKEILPNGKILRYVYEDYRPASKHLPAIGFKLKRVESLDPKERYVYASLTVDGSLVYGWDTEFHFTTNVGEHAHYHLQEKTWAEVFRDKTPRGKPYSVKCKPPLRFPSILSSVSSPFYRFENVGHSHLMQMESMSGKEAPYKCTYGGSPLRINAIYFPTGEKDAFLPLYKMSYETPVPGKRGRGGQTVARRIDGAKIVYHFNPKFLMDEIKWYNPEEKLIKEKLIHWTDQQRLRGIELKDGNGSLFYAKFFESDAYGNPEVETFEGDLTGQGNYEKYVIRREFSQDGKNLLLREEHDDGKVFLYQYLPGTNLVTAKYTLGQNKILLREFSFYDDSNNLIEKILDDGETGGAFCLAGVTQRKITRYLLRQEAPFLHCPQWIEEWYWDGTAEKLLKKTELFYDKIGHVNREEVYGSDGKFSFAITRTVDEQGNILSETNPLGQIATANFTSKGQPSLTVSGSQRLQKKMDYDLEGRLYQIEEKGDEGTVHSIRRTFDQLDRCTEEMDPFGLSTAYTYDAFVDQPRQVEKPPILSSDSRKIPVVSSSVFDALGREVVKVDPNGNRSLMSYNAYGKLTSVIHPDGAQESYTYYPNGDLKTTTDEEGIVASYTYSGLGAITSKTMTSSKGELLSQERFLYKGSLLMQTEDPEGRLTRFFYDGAGRKIAEDHGISRTEWTYDALNRIHSITTINGDQTEIAITIYDLLDRPIEERKEDLSGHILSQQFYEYDADSNKSAVITWSHQETVKETFTYDPFQRLTCHTDELGSMTQTQYDENFLNALGQRVLKKTEIDPMGLQTIDLFDPFGNISSTEKRTDRTLNLEHYYRDPNSNLTMQVSDIYASGEFERSATTYWEFDAKNRKILLSEAYGTSYPKTTRYTYTPKGRLFQTIKPDGIIVERTYDHLGHLKTLGSSDQSCLYAYKHNRVGELLELKDLLTQQSTIRTYDFFGRMIQEKLANDLTLQNAYDAMNRRILLTLPDGSGVSYLYDPLRLREVARVDASGQELYSHHYLTYDLSGHLLQQQLIGSLGSMEFFYNELGTKYQQSNPFASHRAEQFDLRGNILKLSTSSPLGFDVSEYTYDDLSQLESETGLFTNCYRADSHNNRLQKNNSAYRINDLNQILEVEDQPIEYDPNGNPLSKNGMQFRYDALDRLVEITKDTSRLTFTYDGLHRRLSKHVYTLVSNQWQLISSERFLYDGQNEIGVVSPTGDLQELRVLGSTPHAEIGSAVALELGQTLYAPLHDFCDNVAFLVKPDNTLVETYRYSAFGEEKIYSPNHQVTNSQVGNPWRFSSKRKDDESGLIYYGRRYYDPELGRWQTPDPEGFTDGMNLYAFVHNDPLIYLDDYGLWMTCRPPGAFFPQEARQSGCQFAAGLAHHAVDFGFSTLKFMTSLSPGIMSQAYAFNGQSRAMSSDQSLDQMHQRVNQTLFGRMDVNSSAFQAGNISGKIADYAMPAAALMKGAYWLAKGGSFGQLGLKVFDGLASLKSSGLSTVNRPATSSMSAHLVKNNSSNVLFNFGKTASQHMNNPARRIPVHILGKIIESPIACTKDPRGLSDAMMYYSQIRRNGKLYNVEVLYNKKTNQIIHFKYDSDSLGPLNKIK